MTQDLDQPIPFTQKKFDELKEEQRKLLAYQEEVLVRLKTAREMGDLSENGGYRYAKFELGNTRRQLRGVNDQLRRGYVPERTQSPQDDAASTDRAQTIGFDSRIELAGPAGLIKYHLVSEYESDPAQGKLGMTSPLGQVLLGMVSGQAVSISMRNGQEVEYKIVSVS